MITKIQEIAFNWKVVFSDWKNFFRSTIKINF